MIRVSTCAPGRHGRRDRRRQACRGVRHGGGRLRRWGRRSRPRPDRRHRPVAPRRRSRIRRRAGSRSGARPRLVVRGVELPLQTVEEPAVLVDEPLGRVRTGCTGAGGVLSDSGRRARWSRQAFARGPPATSPIPAACTWDGRVRMPVGSREQPGTGHGRRPGGRGPGAGPQAGGSPRGTPVAAAGASLLRHIRCLAGSRPACARSHRPGVVRPVLDAREASVRSAPVAASRWDWPVPCQSRHMTVASSCR